MPSTSAAPSAASNALAGWIRARSGFVNGALDLCADCGPARGRGVIALEAIEKGAVLLRIPRDCALTARSHATGTVETRLPDTDGFKSLSPYLRSALIVLREKLRGDESPWAAVFESFPTEFDLARSWSADEQTELRGTETSAMLRLGSGAGRGGGAVELVWRSDVAPLLALPEHRDEWAGADLESFAWACDCTTSRGFDDEMTGATGYGSNFRVISSSFWFEGPYLLPAVDMLNHDAAMPCTSLTVLEDGAFAMIAERAVARGEEVCHRYQDLPDSRLLITYGFTLGDANAIPPAPRVTLKSVIACCAVVAVSCLLFTVTFHANHAHNLTRSP